MKKRWIALLIAVCAFGMIMSGCSDNTKYKFTPYPEDQRIEDTRNLSAVENTLYNTVAQDDFNRRVVAIDGNKKDKNRYVGMFYFLWSGAHSSGGVYDVTKILQQSGRAGFETDSASSPVGAMHYWGEPLFGYYYSADEWVIRKHLEMLTLMGVDFLFLDTTNGELYQNVTDVLFPIVAEYRAVGWPVPQIVYYMGGGGNTSTDLQNLRTVYNRYYKNPKYDDVWFKPNGKPLAVNMRETVEELPNGTLTDKAMAEFFEFKFRQWPKEAPKNQGFPWIDFSYPQKVYRKNYTDSTSGMMNVSVAQHVTVKMSDTVGSRGRGWTITNGNDSSRWQEDLNFQEQWKSVREHDSELEYVTITGWNEWTMTKFGPPEYSEIFAVDQYNNEYSRDLEPSKNGNKDNGYLLAIKELRTYRGEEAKHYKYPKLSPSYTDLSDETWEQAAHFADFGGDTVARDGLRADLAVGMNYVDTSNRNDFTDVYVARDNRYLYFKVACVNDITAKQANDISWMNIHISTQNREDKDARGYEYVINRIVSGNQTEIHKASGSTYKKVGTGDITVSGKYMVVRLPLSTLGLSESNYDIEFKVSDNVTAENELSFYTLGDSAPYGRLSYKYGY